MLLRWRIKLKINVREILTLPTGIMAAELDPYCRIERKLPPAGRDNLAKYLEELGL